MTLALFSNGPLAERAAMLQSVLRGMDDVAVAVSGGVDSLTLASFVWRVLGESVLRGVRLSQHHYENREDRLQVCSTIRPTQPVA